MRTVGIFVLAAAAAVGLVLLPGMVMEKAPLAPYYELLFNQKIFYYHVPCAWSMFAGAFVCGIASIGFLATRKPGWDDVAAAGGTMVVVFGAIVLTTGPIWAKASWGMYWKWDARLTTSLLLWMIFLAYALVRRYAGPGSERLAAGFAVFGMANVPLTYFAVNFWRTQHPENTVVRSLAPAMRSVFYTGTLAILCLFGLLLWLRLGVGRAARRLESAELEAAELGLLES